MQKTKQDRATEAFMEVWTSLFTTPVHLDSAISKQPATVKSILARTLPAILLRPVSLAQAMGVGVAIGEPWSLTSAQKARWKVAPQLFAALRQPFHIRPARLHVFVFHIAQPSAEHRKPVAVSHECAPACVN